MTTRTDRHPLALALIIGALVTATATLLAGIATHIASDYYKQREPVPALVRMAGQ